MWSEPRSLYVRRTVPVEAAGGVVREAWVYLYNERFGPAAGRGPRVESGDWRAHLAGARGTHTVSNLPTQPTQEDPR